MWRFWTGSARLATCLDRGLPVSSVTINVDGRELAIFRVGEPTTLGGPRGLLISQADIELALRDRLTDLGGSVDWGRPVTGIAVDADGVTVRLEDIGELTAGWVVGADGAHSTVRKAAGVGFPGVPMVERFSARRCAHRPLPAREAPPAAARADTAGRLPVTRSRLLAGDCPCAPRTADNPGRARSSTYLGAGLADETARDHGPSCGPRHSASSAASPTRYRCDRVLLAGDAAHIHSPLGGQGINTGIGDAENLAWKLALVVAGGAAASLLDTYQTERRPIARASSRRPAASPRWSSARAGSQRLLRDHVAVPLLDTGWLQRRITEKPSQLNFLPYADPSARGDWRRLPVSRPATESPTRLCIRPDGSAVRLYDALGPAWALLGPEPLADAARERLGAIVALSVTGTRCWCGPTATWRGGVRPGRPAAMARQNVGTRAGALTP